MKTHKFVRKPLYVDAVRVTPDNMDAVAEWCEGEVQNDADGKFIRVKVYRPINDRQTKAYVGDWVLLSGGFKVYTPKAFDKTFEKVRTLTKEQADEAGIKPPIEKKRRPRKEPANPVITEEGAARLREFAQAEKEKREQELQVEKPATTRIPPKGQHPDALLKQAMRNV